jgi:hypothetical protein
MKDAMASSEQVSQFVFDDFNSFQNLILVACTSDDHFSAAENKANDLWIVKAINQARELFWLVLNFVEWKVER